MNSSELSRSLVKSVTRIAYHLGCDANRLGSDLLGCRCDLSPWVNSFVDSTAGLLLIDEHTSFRLSMFSLRRLTDDLAQTGQLVRITDEVNPYLEAAEIQRRVYLSGGPAIRFENVTDCQFPMVSNLFGTMERSRYIFRNTYESVRRAIELKIDPKLLLKNPWRYRSAPLTAWHMRPQRVLSGTVLENTIRLCDLPGVHSWPNDGGPFITLPQVYTEHPSHPGFDQSNLGMYRVQLRGNQYAADREVGLHYQIHRGIGVHHRAAIEQQAPLRVNIFVGGHPAMTLAAVMPLPEGLSELTFAGALAGSRIRMAGPPNTLPVYADADFCICGTVDPSRLLPEGPFGDHLGYYSLVHDFPVLKVDRVYARKDAIWPFTVVGRPPQEDTTFGQLIHELTGPIIPTVLPGIKEVHAVDAAGVHPLLLAIGSERYMPFTATDRPQELLTQANAILGQGQMSLAKYVFIGNRFDDESLDLHDIGRFFDHILARVDWRYDVHFQTCTTIDTLDYSGDGFNQGSKVVIAARGPQRRSLGVAPPEILNSISDLIAIRVARPGVLVVQVSVGVTAPATVLAQLPVSLWDEWPLVVVVDDCEFAQRSLNNWLWVTFTRSNPAADISGIGESIRMKHWGCTGALVIDARVKPHHAPPLIEDPQVTRKIDAMAARGGELAKWL